MLALSVGRRNTFIALAHNDEACTISAHRQALQSAIFVDELCSNKRKATMIIGHYLSCENVESQARSTQ
jgi:hypothetical protein